MLAKLADRIVRNRWWVIAAVAGVTVLMGWQATKVGLNADFSTYLRQDDPLVAEYNRIGDIFGGNAMGMVLLTTDNVFRREILQTIRTLTEAYEEVDGIAYVTSLANVVDFRKSDWGLEVGRLLERGEIPQTAEELAALKSYVLGKDRYAGNLVSADGTTAAIILRFAGGGNRAVSQFATALRVKAATDAALTPGLLPEGARIYYGGMPFLIFNMTLLITENLEVLVPLMVLVLVAILYFGFRHWAGVVFPLLVVLVSDVWVVGLMGMFGLNFDLLSGIMPVVLLALASADGIHLLKRYFERRRSGEGGRQAARTVFQDMGKPIVLTTITTMVGFASLSISDFSVIKQFGLLTALGVLLALVVTLTLLPALLSFGVTPRPARRKKRDASFLADGLAVFVYRHKAGVLVTAALIVGFAVLAIPKIEKDVDWSLCLQKGSAPFHAEMLLRQKFGGSLPIQVLVDGDLKEPAVLAQMRDIERRLETVPLVRKSQSIAGVLAEMNDVMNDRFTVPETREGVTNLWFLVEGEEMLEQMVAEGEQEGLLQARLSTWHTGSLVAAVDSIDAFLRTLPDTIAVVELTRLDRRARQRLQPLRAQEIVRDLQLDLRKYGLELPAERLHALVQRALDFRIDADARARVRDAVRRYLRSEEAEATLPPAVVERFAGRVAGALSDDAAVDAGTIRAILQATARNLPEEDAGFLAESVAAQVTEAVAETRVTPVLTALQQTLPEDARSNPNLRRDLKGALWQANAARLYLDATVAETLLAGQTDAVTRQVTWQVRQTGLAPVLKRMEEELTPTQVESLLTSLFFVIILLAVIHRSALGGVLSVAPITVTILVNFAVMGTLGIGLDSFTAMIASVAIGLGIDTDIHFVSRLRAELRVDGDELAALKRTIRTTGASIVVNALAVGLGFLVLLAAGGQHIRRFGGLTALTILLSALFTLTILPALFLWLKPKFLRLAAKEAEEPEPALAGTVADRADP